MTFFKNDRGLMSYERKCSNCIHAHKLDDEYDKVYECDADVFDIKNLSCFVPKEEKPDGQS